MSFFSRILHRRSIQEKFLAITIPLVLVATFTLFSLFEFRTHQIALQNLRDDLEELLASQGAALSNPLWNVDDVQIALTLAAIRSNRSVLGVQIFDESGSLFDSAGVMEEKTGNTIVGERIIAFDDGDGPRAIGRLRVAVTDRWVREATLLRMVLAGGMAILVVISVILSAVLGFRRTIGVPLERLLASIQHTHKGDARQRVNWHSEDEIGAVVSAFNELQSEQEAYEEELRHARDTLEQRVEERTAELEATRDRAQRAQNQLTEALQSIEQGFALYDRDDRLVLWNERYREQLYPGVETDLRKDISFEQILRNALALGLIEDARDNTEEWLRERLQRHRSPAGTHQQRRTGGRWIQISERRTDDGGTVAVYTDITEMKRREHELADMVHKVEIARDEAEAANEAKSAFLAMMSHEIRTPMNAIIGMTSLLLNTKLSPEQEEFSETIRHSGESLLEIINEVLDFSKIDAGRMEIERHPFDLRECIENSIDLLAAKAAEKGIELAYLVDESVPSGIKSDATRLRQILVNLLSNAVKFTDQGEVVLSVTGGRTEEDVGADGPMQELEFSVRDTGIGIPPDRMDRLFRSFSQVDASTSRRYGGTGLGLAISKRLSELMGGTIWAESAPGEGTTFHLTIHAEAAPIASREYLNEVNPTLDRKRILVVDDNATNRRILSLQSASWGMRSIEAASPAEALALIRDGEPLDVAILDMQMPDMDGTALATAIRNERSETDLPLVLLSSLGVSPGAPGDGVFAASLMKPVKPSQLYNTLVSVFLKEPIPAADGERTLSQRFDPGMAARLPLRILLVEDNTTNQKLALRLLEQFGYRADVAGNGYEALEALERQNYDIVLMDLQMPEMDGLEATRRIRSRWTDTGGPRVVAMTANAMQGDREMCLAAGMNDYVSKPIRVKELVRVLSSAAEGRKNPRPEDTALDFRPADRASAETGAVNPGALDSLRTLVGGQEHLDEMIDAFLDDAPKLVAELRSGFERGDVTLLTRAAHTLKSNGTDFGASTFSKLCRELESRGRSGSLADVEPLVSEVEREFERVKAALGEMG